jgi:RHS repeat-associated protein
LNPQLQPYNPTSKISNGSHPFGSVMNGRSFSNEGYRFGFNGMERDNETFTDAYDFGARILDTRLGRWLSVDPKSYKFPFESQYIFCSNTVIKFKDFHGEYKVDPNFSSKYPLITNYIKNNLKSDVNNCPKLKENLMKYSKLNETDLNTMLSFNSGPTIDHYEIVFNAGGQYNGCNPDQMQGAYDYFSVNTHLLDKAEGILKDPNSTELEKQSAILAVTSVIFHESTHYGDYLEDCISEESNEDGDWGAQFEVSAYGIDIGSSRDNLPFEDQGDSNKIFEAYLADAEDVITKCNDDESKKIIPSIPQSSKKNDDK